MKTRSTPSRPPEFGYADNDGDALSSVKITGLPTAGTLKLDGTPIASGVLPKTVAAADLAAGKLTYTPPANANKTAYASFTFKVNDGTADSAQYTMTIDVTAVNDAPTAANPTVTTNEDTPYAFAAARFGYADIDSDALSSVKITGLPTAGTLKLDGTPIASDALPKTVAAADLAGKLTYTPPPNANKTAYASFTFKVNDGTVDSAQYTMTIDVTAVNDAATGAPTISGTAEVGQTLTASTAEISDVDGVPNSFTYQWKRYAANGTTFEANIGEDARTYTLTESEEGKKVKVDVRFRDNGGSPEGPLLSAAYPASLSETVGARPVVNTLPTAANGTVTTREDTPYAFAAARFGYVDDRWRCAVEREDHRAAHRGHAEAGRHADRLGRPAEGGCRGRPGRREADVHPARQREREGLRELHVQGQRRDGGQRPIHHDHRRHRRERCADGGEPPR